MASAVVAGCSPRVVEVEPAVAGDASTSGELADEGTSTGAPVPPPPNDDPPPNPVPDTTTTGGASSESSGGFVGGILEPGDPSECLVGGNVLVLDGEFEDYIHPGYEVYLPGTWTLEPKGEPLNELELSYNLGKPPGEYTYWDVWIRTALIPAPLEMGVYEDAQRTPFEDEGRPGLSVSGDHRGCNRLSGSYEVHELEVVDGNVESITLTWSQSCEPSGAVLLGCAHWEAE